MEPNYSGWATKSNMKCADGRTIMPGFAKAQDGQKVPLLYQHNHKDMKAVFGHAILKNTEDGTWADLYFNDSPEAQGALTRIEHGDIDKLSIWAKNLEERVNGRDVLVHDGVIQEVSLVISGSNPGAGLANVLMHDGFDDDDLMMVGFELNNSAELKELAHADTAVEETTTPPTEDSKTVLDALETLNDEQQLAVNAFIDEVIKEAVTEALAENPVIQHDNLDAEKGENMNLFDQAKQNAAKDSLPQLKHSDVTAVLTAAKGNPTEGVRGLNESNAVGSLREFVRSSTGKELMHADDYGVQNMDILFPDAQLVMSRPTWVDRRQEWVKKFMAGTSHTPFSRIKTLYADITADEARARGYIKGNRKIEEVFPVFKRVTGPAWIYKKQKLDRQDIIDIVDFDVVAWMKAEMRMKLDEEIARAGLFGDNRPTMVGGELNPDKILEPFGASGDGIRSVVNDDDLYSTTYNVSLAADAIGQDWNALLDATVLANEYYLGSGNKTAFVSYRTATRLLTMRDDWGKRIYRNLSEVAGDMDVNEIVRVPSELFPTDVLAVVLDLSDYNFGTNRGGEITLFDDFDIHFNQYFYLMETYLSGALVLPYAAQIFKRVDPAGTKVEDNEITKPTLADNVVTIPTTTGVVYKRTDTNAVVAGGSTITLNDTNQKQVSIEAFPADGFYFDSNSDRKDTFTFRYKAPA